MQEFEECMWKLTPVRNTPSHLCSKWSCHCRLWCSEQLWCSEELWCSEHLWCSKNLLHFIEHHSSED